MSVERGRKWHPLPAPSPKILQLPRRSRLSRTANPASTKKPTATEPRRNLGTLFEQERSFSSGRDHVESLGEEEGRWKFQAEILGAECKFLRMEREVALRKLENNRTKMEAALRSGRKKIDGCESIGTALEEEVEPKGKMEENWRRRRRMRVRCGSNFDRKALVLRRQLERVADETNDVKDIREIAESSTSPRHNVKEKKDDEASLEMDPKCRVTDVEMLRRKMEGLSKGMLECGYDLLLPANSSSSTVTTTTTSSNTSKSGSQRIGYREMAESSNQKQGDEKEMGAMRSESCCNCKEAVGRIAEQVKAETEQWTEMQGMLDQVRMEMEELQTSRDLWQRRAMASELNLRSIYIHMLEWKQRARSSEQEVIELQKHLSELKKSLRAEVVSPPTSSSSWTHSDISIPVGLPRIKCQHQRQQQRRLPDYSNMEKEKPVLVCHLNNSQSKFPRRSPLQDIGNLSPLPTRAGMI